MDLSVCVPLYSFRDNAGPLNPVSGKGKEGCQLEAHFGTERLSKLPRFIPYDMYLMTG
jgi:hypothetical protein